MTEAYEALEKIENLIAENPEPTKEMIKEIFQIANGVLKKRDQQLLSCD